MGKKYSFFPGRFQPLHEGHLALFDKVRKDGNDIAVGIMDTEIDEDNPYTVEERVRMFQEKAPHIKLYRIPAIKEICWGRDVGYGRRAINLPTEIECLSASDLRADKHYNPEPTMGDNLD
jgi:cytidyltransferase-like protein